MEFAKGIDPNLLGSATDEMLVLLVEKQNRSLKFERNTRSRSAGRRNSVPESVRRYLAGGEMSDAVLDFLIRSASSRQKSFTYFAPKGRQARSPGLRLALRNMHDAAAKLHWTAREFIYQGFLTSENQLAVSADLVLDSTLLEVKMTKDGNHHTEHLAQLFAYYLTSQAPIRKPHHRRIDELGIYYARHGVLTKQPTASLLQIPTHQLKRVAFDFLVEFAFWRDSRRLACLQSGPAESLADVSFNDTLRLVYPRPDWLASHFEAEKSSVRRGGQGTTGRIPIPVDFLLDGEGG